MVMWLQNITLTQVCNVIVLVSAVIIAGKNIWSFFKKPVDDIHARASEKEEQHIEEILQREMPGLLEQNCNVIIGSLNELKQMTMAQEKQLNDIYGAIELLNQSQLDMMRYDMNKIYYKYRPFKKILSADKKAFIKIYNDYKSMDGNTWIDTLYAELKDWPIVEDESELRGNN